MHLSVIVDRILRRVGAEKVVAASGDNETPTAEEAKSAEEEYQNSFRFTRRRLESFRLNIFFKFQRPKFGFSRELGKRDS